MPAYTNAQGYGLGYQVLAYGARYLGVPYVWGGTTPAGFDCSGLVQFVYGHFGIRLPRTSQEQAKVGIPVSKGNLQPGDLLFFNSDPGDPQGVTNSHVAIYAGNGQELEAPHTGDVVKLHPIDWATFNQAMRVTSGTSGGSIAPAGYQNAGPFGPSLGDIGQAFSEFGTVVKDIAIVSPFLIGGLALVVWGVVRGAGSRGGEA